LSRLSEEERLADPALKPGPGLRAADNPVSLRPRRLSCRLRRSFDARGSLRLLRLRQGSAAHVKNANERSARDEFSRDSGADAWNFPLKFRRRMCAARQTVNLEKVPGIVSLMLCSYALSWDEPPRSGGGVGGDDGMVGGTA
jgi:hypothetical protein